jgi:hypothetical protein
VNEFICRQDGRGVVGDVYLEGGVHLVIGIAIASYFPVQNGVLQKKLARKRNV